MGQRTDARYDTDDNNNEYIYDDDYDYDYFYDNNNCDGNYGDDDDVRRTTFFTYLSHVIFFFAYDLFNFLNFFSL